jgi:hypothetical protein
MVEQVRQAGAEIEITGEGGVQPRGIALGASETFALPDYPRDGKRWRLGFTVLSAGRERVCDC